ncbi:MAG: hypothetical protein A2679_01270 [Candidatus Sungbacteria bacterium RIFCSPHIGHO2_01_FULL_54_26]|nr:MAG: hypothetical protein A2679_01270 [Candidatus Sungbacteria bacterium RIFCSPHIGHO2_01_FULL_54_26]
MMTDRFAYSSKIVLYIIAAVMPLLAVPAPLGTDIGRDVAFVALTAIAGVLWLIGVLARGEMRYPVSPLLWAGAVLIAVWSASAAFSHAPFVSAFFAEAGAERLITLVAGLALMAATGGILKNRGAEADATAAHASAGTLLFVLIFSGAAAGLLTLYTFVVGPIGFLPTQPFFNVIGTVNSMALLYAVLLMMTVGLLLSRAVEGWKTWVRAACAAAALIFLADIAFVHFWTAWILVLVASVCLFGLLLIDVSKHRPGDVSGDNVRRFGWRQWTALGLVIFSIAMIMAPGAIIGKLEAPAEISPSASATFSIAGNVFREGPLRVFLGSGPAMFGLDWAKYKDPAINQTAFWGVRFNQGQSWVATALPTGGILGLISLIGFFAVSLFVFLRILLSSSSAGDGTMQNRTGDPLVMSSFLGWVTLLIAAFLYPANTSLLLLLFFLAGLLAALLAVPAHAVPEMTEDARESEVSGDRLALAGRPSIWSIRERMVRFETPGMIFASSLVIIFCIALGIAALYGQVGRVRAALAADRGATAFNAGKIDDAIGLLERAVQYEPRNWRNVQMLTQARIGKVRSVIQRAAAGENVQQDFQSAVSLAIQDAQHLTAMHPQDPTLWRIQGSLYESIIPFIPGSERIAAGAYQRAIEREPLNPAAYVEWGRAGLVFADRLASAAQQAQGKEREDLEKARVQNLEQIVAIFQRAIQAKQDYAPAHFLLAQTAIRLGNLDAAIQSVENTKLIAPFDIGVAFQLGLLYYQKNDLARAQAEFERAISMNEQYANARYFLGLIYDRKKDRTRALEEFGRIAATNPDNQEIQRIIANVKAGKPALEGIVPPAVPPQQRTDVPVKEQEQRR